MYRQLRELSTRDIASLVNVSPSFISQLERGRTGATIGTLMRIATALNISMADLFGAERPHTNRVLTRSDRPVLESADGFHKTLLSQRPIRNIEACIGEFEPGASTGNELYTHGDSQEILLVLRGSITCFLGDAEFEMAAGDSLEYRSSERHGIRNTGTEDAEVLWMVSPATDASAHPE